MIQWTYTKLETYETCPKKFHAEHVTRESPFVASSATIEGREQHESFETAVRDGSPLPAKMQSYAGIVQTLRTAPGVRYCELKTAVNERYIAVDFWSNIYWNRGVEDIVIINNRKALSLDYKTGKEKKSRQLEASAARLFAWFPEIDEISTGYYWLKTNKLVTQRFVRDDVSTIWGNFQPTLDKMKWSFDHDVWPARPSGLCKKSNKPGSDYPGCLVASCPFSPAYVG